MLQEQTKSTTIEERFIVRPPKMSDMEDVLEMLEICDIHAIGEVEVSIDVLQTDWTLPTVSLERNFRVVTTQNGRVIAFAELWDTDEPLVMTWAWARVHPEFEGLGIGTYLLEWSEQTSLESMARAPKEAQFTIQAGAKSTYQPANDLLINQGMKLNRIFSTMMIDLDEQPDAPQLPGNIVIRPMQSVDQLPAVVHAIEDSFQDHWGYVEQDFEKELAHWQHIVDTDPTFDQTLWFLAMDGDQIAGFSICKPNHGPNYNTGWVDVLGVLRPWRKRGLGLALLKHSFGELYQRDKTKVGLGVDADSLTGATRLYERAGMRPTRQFNTYQKILRPGIDMIKRTAEE